MVAKRVCRFALCASLLVWAGSTPADEYRPDEFLGLDLSAAVLSPKRLGPPTGFAPVAIEARRSAPGRVALRWDASSHPMVMVRDANSGEVLSLARGGTAELFTERTDLDLLVSNRVQSRLIRVVVPR